MAASGGQLLRRNVKRFRRGLVFKAHRLVYHSTLGVRSTKKDGEEAKGRKYSLGEAEDVEDLVNGHIQVPANVPRVRRHRQCLRLR